MKAAALSFTALTVGSACSALLLGCSGEKADRLENEVDSPPSSTSPTDPPAPASDGGGPGSVADAAGSEDGGTDAALDAGADAAGLVNAFTGAPAYASQTGPTTRKAQHDFPANTPRTNPAGQACLRCHRAGGNATEFSAAGTVYQNATGTTPAASVEVRAVGADGNKYSAYTNADGNFFFPASTKFVDVPAAVGARNASSTRLMVERATNGNCNNCHSTAGGAGRLVVSP